MTVQIGQLTVEHIERCAELEQRLFVGDDPWSIDAFAAELAAGHHYVGAFNSVELVGYAGIALLGSEMHPEAEIHTMAVDPAWQRQGIGKKLLQHLLAHADSVGATTFLEVRVDNDPAIALYEAHGFTHLGLRKRYYQPSGADAFTMRRYSPARSDRRPA